MEFNQFWQILSRKKQTIFSIMLIAIVIVLVVTILSPIKYGAQSRVLVMQEGRSMDAYTLSRTNEYLGNLFSQIIYSSSFFNLVANNNNYQVDNNYFGSQQSEQLKTWRKTVNTRSYGDTGIIEINVYHTNPEQARQIALAVNDTLTTHGYKYSGNENIKINVIDQPLVSERPVKPNIPYTVAITIIGSFVLALIFIYIFPERKYDLSLFGKGKKRKEKKKEVENNDNFNVEEIKEEEPEENDDIEEYSSKLDDYYKDLGKHNEDEISGDIDNIVK